MNFVRKFKEIKRHTHAVSHPLYCCHSAVFPDHVVGWLLSVKIVGPQIGFLGKRFADSSGHDVQLHEAHI